jgi:hypothetical protein
LALIKQKRLDHSAPTADEAPEVISGELWVKGRRAQVACHGVRMQLAVGHKVHVAEPPELDGEAGAVLEIQPELVLRRQ